MARAKKSNPSSNKAANSSKGDATDQIDPLVVTETLQSKQDIATDAPEPPAEDAAVEETAVPSQTPPIEDAVLGDSTAQDISPENSEKKAAEIVHAVPVTVEQESKYGFFPLLLGGVLAGGIGFLVAELDMFGSSDQGLDVARLTTEISAQGERITALESASLAVPDTSGFEAMQSDLSSISETIASFGERISALESRPIAVDSETGAADAYAEELARLRASFEEQRGEIEKQRAEIKGLLTNARSVEEATAIAARASAGQAALARIISALESGQAIAGPVSELKRLGTVEVPEALAKVAEKGVVTLADLQARFPDNSRAALAAARANAPQEGDGGLGGFLKRQLGARSVAPREGTDADAVLSRAEDAVRNGRLTDALAEIDTLPEVAQSTMQGWIADARARDAALAAADKLAQRLTAN